MSMYWIIFIGFALLSWLVSSRLQGKFEKYSKIPMPNGMTGKDVAEKMLHDNGIYDVKVISTPGHLTDHYNPANQTVNLSESVYYSNSIAAAAVAGYAEMMGLPPPLRLPPMSAVTPCSMLPLTLRYGCVRLWFRLLVSPLIS